MISFRFTSFRTALLALIAAAFTAAANPLALAQTEAAPDSTPHSNGVAAAVSDTAITAKVKSKLLTDEQFKNAQVSVTTTNGVVSLSGTAPTADVSNAAAAAAQSVNGVKSVDNQIRSPSLADTAASKVDRAASNTGKAVSDSWITTKVKSELLSDSAARKADVSVKTSNGVVALSGTADSREAVDHIKDLAQQVHGVKSVDASALKTP